MISMAPGVVIHLPFEGTAFAYVLAGSDRDEQRVRLDLDRSDVEFEIAEALERLRSVLADRSSP